MKKTFRKYIAAALSAVLLCSEAFAIPSAASSQIPKSVIVGGTPFGIKLYSDGLTVAEIGEVETSGGTVSPARDAGIIKGDIVKELSGKTITSAEEFSAAVENSSGQIELTIERKGEKLTVAVMPVTSDTDGKRRIGLWLKDSTAGIGTVTFVIPETGEFAGLGHGVCDTETGEPVSLSKGTVGEVRISGVKRGEAGAPGELKGFFTGKDCGNVSKNTKCGVFGAIIPIPPELISNEQLPVGERSDVHVGKAHIMSTVGSGREQFEIEITKIPEDITSHSFEICVTDHDLIEKTGGIVQGMSGSPIIQNGKLVGAVTHVMISDPTRGYGIYIENMLDAAR